MGLLSSDINKLSLLVFFDFLKTYPHMAVRTLGHANRERIATLWTGKAFPFFAFDFVFDDVYVFPYNLVDVLDILS